MGCLIHGERCTCPLPVREEAQPCPPEPRACPPPSAENGPSVRFEFGGQSYEDLRIGGLVRSELSRGGCWHRKDGGGVDISFSLTLLELAGGIRRLFAGWQPETGSLLALEEIPYRKMQWPKGQLTFETVEVAYRRGEFRPQEASRIVADESGVRLGDVLRNPTQARKLAEVLMRAADFAEQRGCPADAIVE